MERDAEREEQEAKPAVHGGEGDPLGEGVAEAGQGGDTGQDVMEVGDNEDA